MQSLCQKAYDRDESTRASKIDVSEDQALPNCVLPTRQAQRFLELSTGQDLWKMVTILLQRSLKITLSQPFYTSSADLNMQASNLPNVYAAFQQPYQLISCAGQRKTGHTSCNLWKNLVTPQAGVQQRALLGRADVKAPRRPAAEGVDTSLTLNKRSKHPCLLSLAVKLLTMTPKSGTQWSQPNCTGPPDDKSTARAQTQRTGTRALIRLRIRSRHLHTRPRAGLLPAAPCERMHPQCGAMAALTRE